MNNSIILFWRIIIIVWQNKSYYKQKKKILTSVINSVFGNVVGYSILEFKYLILYEKLENKMSDYEIKFGI